MLRLVSEVVLALLLAGLLFGTFEIRLVKAGGTICAVPLMMIKKP